MLQVGLCVKDKTILTSGWEMICPDISDLSFPSAEKMWASLYLFITCDRKEESLGFQTQF